MTQKFLDKVGKFGHCARAHGNKGAQPVATISHRRAARCSRIRCLLHLLMHTVPNSKVFFKIKSVRTNTDRIILDDSYYLVSRTFPGFPALGLEYRIIVFLIKSYLLKEANLYSQSRKSGKCFTN